MILAVGHTKGGVGKTTLAVNIAIARMLQGRDVLLIDGDRQGSALSSLAVRSEAGHAPTLACAAYTDGPTLRAQVLAQAPKYDDVIIDAGGRDNSAMRGALMVADTLLVPFAPRTYEVWALDDIAQIIADARAVRDGLRAFAVLNMADTTPGSSANREAVEAAGQLGQLDYLDAPLRRRNAFSAASGQGLCVHEIKPRDRKAEAELDALVAAIFAS